jgi:phosphoribosyl 1,2-cyclic phosphate phosphodiesterase
VTTAVGVVCQTTVSFLESGLMSQYAGDTPRSGDALGVPAPLCDCTYCETSEERRRPSLLVEIDAATVVLDVSPDLRHQLHATRTTDVDAFDSDERPDDTDTTLYVRPTAGLHFSYAYSHLSDRFDPELLAHGDPQTVGDLDVVPFPVDHARPLFDTVGFAVCHGDEQVVYAPDVQRFLPEWDAGGEHEDADLLFAEGSALFGAETHGSSDALRAALEDADAARTVLVNVNEHRQRTHTEALASQAAELGYELGRDFETYRP